MRLVLASADQIARERSKNALEEEPPKLACLLETFGLESFNTATRGSKLLGGAFDSRPDIRIEGNVIEAKPDAYRGHVRHRVGRGYRGREGIAPVVACKG